MTSREQTYCGDSPPEPGGICMFLERHGAGPEAATVGNQRLYLNDTRVAQMSGTLPLNLN